MTIQATLQMPLNITKRSIVQIIKQNNYGKANHKRTVETSGRR